MILLLKLFLFVFLFFHFSLDFLFFFSSSLLFIFFFSLYSFLLIFFLSSSILLLLVSFISFKVKSDHPMVFLWLTLKIISFDIFKNNWKMILLEISVYCFWRADGYKTAHKCSCKCQATSCLSSSVAYLPLNNQQCMSISLKDIVYIRLDVHFEPAYLLWSPQLFFVILLLFWILYIMKWILRKEKTT